jgi:hypothetical protein
VAVATVNLRIAPYRLLTKADAAHYCRLSNAQFETQCPVVPVIMPGGDRLWDVKDLDKWIDSLKAESSIADDIVARLR